MLTFWHHFEPVSLSICPSAVGGINHLAIEYLRTSESWKPLKRAMFPDRFYQTDSSGFGPHSIDIDLHAKSFLQNSKLGESKVGDFFSGFSLTTRSGGMPSAVCLGQSGSPKILWLKAGWLLII